MQDDTRGEVHEITDHTVTIRGLADPLPLGKALTLQHHPVGPTPAMVAQAREICPGAEYLSSRPAQTHKYDVTRLYLFRC